MGFALASASGRKCHKSAPARESSRPHRSPRPPPSSPLQSLPPPLRSILPPTAQGPMDCSFSRRLSCWFHTPLGILACSCSPAGSLPHLAAAPPTAHPFQAHIVCAGATLPERATRQRRCSP